MPYLINKIVDELAGIGIAEQLVFGEKIFVDNHLEWLEFKLELRRVHSLEIS